MCTSERGLQRWLSGVSSGFSGGRVGGSPGARPRVGLNVGAAALVFVLGCRLRVARVTKSAVRLVCGLGVGVCLWCHVVGLL